MSASKEEIEMLTRAKALFGKAEIPSKGFVWNHKTNKVEPYDTSKTTNNTKGK